MTYDELIAGLRQQLRDARFENLKLQSRAQKLEAQLQQAVSEAERGQELLAAKDHECMMLHAKVRQLTDTINRLRATRK